jgi:hypothetical protein
MYRIYYETNIRNFNKELFNPTELYKVYNYIYSRDIDLNTIGIGQNFNTGNILQTVIDKDDDGFFIAPGIFLANNLSKQDFTINIAGTSHNVSFNVFSEANSLTVGSLVFPSTSSYTEINIGDTARVVDIHNNIVYLNNLTVTDIKNLDGVYLSETETMVVNFEKTLQLCDWLSKTNNLSIYSLDTVYKDIDMNIYIRCYGGYPMFGSDNPMPKYNLELNDLDSGETTTESIYQFHSQKINAKHRYSFTIKDQLDNSPTVVNDAAHNGPIYVDFSTMESFGIVQKQNTPTRELLVDIAEPLFKRVKV